MNSDVLIWNGFALNTPLNIFSPCSGSSNSNFSDLGLVCMLKLVTNLFVFVDDSSIFILFIFVVFLFCAVNVIVLAPCFSELFGILFVVSSSHVIVPFFTVFLFRIISIIVSSSHLAKYFSVAPVVISYSS